MQYFCFQRELIFFSVYQNHNSTLTASFPCPHRYVHGCLQSCSDADACNSARRQGQNPLDLEALMRHLLSLAALLVAAAR